MRADFDKIRDRICKDKRDRGADGKTAVFGLLKRNGKVFAGVIKDNKISTLVPIIASQNQAKRVLRKVLVP